MDRKIQASKTIVKTILDLTSPLPHLILLSQLQGRTRRSRRTWRARGTREREREREGPSRKREETT